MLKSKYGDSLYKLLSNVYPEYEWLPWKFDKTLFWDNIYMQKHFMNWAGKELGIKEMSGWYKISTKVCFVTVILMKIKGFIGYWWIRNS